MNRIATSLCSICMHKATCAHACQWGNAFMNMMLNGIGQAIADYLQRSEEGYEPFTPSNPDALRATLKPGDVLLVEGNNRISGVIKYLTQSTWSHAALYVGPIGERTAEDGEPLVL